MTAETLRVRIANAENTIAKKQKTIESKRGLLARKQEAIIKAGYSLADREASKKDPTIYWLFCDIDFLNDDLKALSRTIEELRNNICKYQDQLLSAEAEEASYAHEVPECLKTLEQELINEWTDWDIGRREQIKADRKVLTSKEMAQKYTMGERRDLQYASDADILKANQKAARVFVLDLFNRIKNITGEVTDWSDITLAPGARGSAVLNGFVVGKEGKCRVESIYACGPVQRLHVRVLTKKVN